MSIQTFDKYLMGSGVDRESALRSIVDVDLFVSLFTLDDKNMVKDKVEGKRIKILPSIFSDRRIEKYLNSPNKHYHERLRLSSLLYPMLKEHMLVESKSGKLVAHNGFLLERGRKDYVFGFTPEESHLQFNKQILKKIPIEGIKEVVSIYEEALKENGVKNIY